jgi:hypothetical protein
MLEAESDELSRQHILQLLMRNVVRMEAGYETLSRNLQTDDAGDIFARAFLRWAERAIERGYQLLNKNGYETRLAAS